MMSPFTPFFRVESAYMDEVYHIPQAQRFCINDFAHWDPKITTFPGLYLLSAGLHFILKRLIGESDSSTCSLSFLRNINVTLGVVLGFLFYYCRRYILVKINKGKNNMTLDAILLALLLFLYPPSFFYYFLYYTDTLSTLTILLVYWMTLHHNTSSTNFAPPSSLFSASFSSSLILSLSSSSSSFLKQLIVLVVSSSSVLARQTNVVWLLFFAGTSMLQHLESKGIFRDNCFDFATFKRFVLALIMNAPTLISETWPLLLPLLGFACFVVVNKGIVVGTYVFTQYIHYGTILLKSESSIILI